MNLYELEKTLKANHIHPDAVQLGSGLPDANEQYCIVREGTLWEVYYAEKGKKGNIKVFDNEEAACSYLLATLKQDSSVWLKR